MDSFSTKTKNSILITLIFLILKKIVKKLDFKIELQEQKGFKVASIVTNIRKQFILKKMIKVMRAI